MESLGVGVIYTIAGINSRRITLMVSLMSMPRSMGFLHLLSSGRKTTSGDIRSEED
jgi:hypothetical protein